MISTEEQIAFVVAHCRERLDQRADDPCRMFHGRGHCYPGLQGLTVDWFPPYVQVGVFRDFIIDEQKLAAALDASLPELDGISIQYRDGRRTHSRTLRGHVPEEVAVSEAGLRFRVRLQRNQNVGLFLDMAPTRTWLFERARGKRVLNLFAYTCAFSVAALAGGASHVVNVDMSKPALAWGRENHALNGQDPRQVTMLGHNLFKSWWKIRKLAPFDIVIIDPPTNQRGSFNAQKHSGQILKRIPEYAAPGADVLACLNSPFLGSDFLPNLMQRWCPRCNYKGMLANSADFPEAQPERGLKQALFRYA
ncbi:MAG: class I SAM-dependent methyltransferase [Pseudomonadales bacterium]|nr:class I SAM-dependent methyltransferase [Pseudomonadales bacterium]MDP6472886.1 class I SAM-dependent methyltransferase [Pseudomonadales bacterium]MDP6826357.1 class I SAM-dependent methyltransferase [Pseudomonadales bacterium]MDP6973288.1 class I SAM-dependent methyltransferase [Pseudomonadales bacterium]